MTTASAGATQGGSSGLHEVETVDIERDWYLFALSGLISLVIGVLVLAYPDPSVKLLGVFLGIDLLLAGGLLVVRGVTKVSEPAALLLGTLAIIGGVVVIRNPGESLVLVTLAFAIYLIVLGVVALGRALVEKERRGTTIVRGLVLLTAGIVIVSWPDLSLKTLAVLAGISLVLQGAVEIGEAFLLRSVRRASTDH